MVSLLDNDIILKLVACDLFWDFLDGLGLSIKDLKVLPQAKYYFRKSKSAKRKYMEYSFYLISGDKAGPQL